MNGTSDPCGQMSQAKEHCTHNPLRLSIEGLLTKNVRESIGEISSIKHFLTKCSEYPSEYDPLQTPEEVGDKAAGAFTHEIIWLFIRIQLLCNNRLKK